MNKREATIILNEILTSCPSLVCNGFYVNSVGSFSDDSIELRVIAQLDEASRKTIKSLISKRGVNLIEERNLLRIY